jgi:hypothetical protein
MIQLIKFIILTVYVSCQITSSYSFGQINLSDTTTHFYSIVDREKFDTLSGTDFTWIVFEPINDTLSYTPFDQRPAFINRLSNEQKALFYIWELERAVFGGKLGFTNFYYNYNSYFQNTINGLTLINDTSMLKVMYGVNNIYSTQQKQIKHKYKSGDWKYIQRQFAFFDRAFLEIHEHTMTLLEGLIRLNENKFIRFK